MTEAIPVGRASKRNLIEGVSINRVLEHSGSIIKEVQVFKKSAFFVF